MNKIKISNVLVVLFSLLAIISGMLINFNSFLNGSKANMLDVYVTISYVLIWILILLFGTASYNKTIIRYCVYFWFLNVFMAFTIVYSFISDTYLIWEFPLAVILYGQWRGFAYYMNNFYTSVLVLLISFIMWITSYLVSRINKGN
ncbi:hypothetical protein BHU72_14695 [Desulfuribacillus stibiiarsenatis]|uniref:Uncharacterized protein n=1 Tax=Desulfuribacillus stibiiarsenatis TaxID=1390249 RepID=A0A1E5L7F6_9FIRM|nr:hypothetical protein BHU72_14695 [Desulfuribacillus stibiiarsenatis]